MRKSSKNDIRKKDRILFRRTITKVLFIAILLGAAFLLLSDYLSKEYIKASENSRKKHLKQLVHSAFSTIKPELENYRSGLYSREKALTNVRNIVRRMTFPEGDSKNYIFMSGYNGTMLVQPFEPQKEMTNQLGLKDSNGKFIIKELINQARSDQGSGFVSYYYPPPGSSVPEEKMSFVIGIPELKCYIGAGRYMGDIRAKQASFRLKVFGLQLILFILLLLLIVTYIHDIWKKNNNLRNEISIRQRSEQNLKESEARMKTLVEAIPDLVWLKDPKGVYISCNHKFELLYGALAEKIIGKTDYDFVDKKMADFFRIKDQEAIAAGKMRLNEEELTFANDGHKALMETLKTPIYNFDGSLIGVLGVARDITVRKQQEVELKKLRNFLTSIINSMPSILIGVDTNGNVNQWNNKAAEYTGIEEEKALGQLLSKVVPEMSSDMNKIFYSIKHQEPLKENKKIYRNHGEVRYMDVTIYPLDSNNQNGAVIRIDDVTKEQHLEEQLNQSRKMDAIGQLAGGVAHDFNNMLTAIIGAAQMLQTLQYNQEEKPAMLLNAILQASERASDLTSKLLAFSRKGKVSSAAINIHHVIEDTVSILIRSIDKKIRISTWLNAENYTVSGDNSALQSALMNMGINAAHAMPDGGELSVMTQNLTLPQNYCGASQFDIKPGEYVEIQIRDTGSGISPENLSKIFEPFFTTKEQGKGTGLGLAAVYGTIQEHHGAITVYSEPGVGTVFHVYLPCTEELVEEKHASADAIKGSGLILLVDDEELIRITGECVLRELGYDVITAENGRQAVKIFEERSNEIDIIIMDMIMPEMNGRDAFFKMKEINAGCKVLLSSGFTKDESMSDLMAFGLSGFLSKPYRDYELSQALDKLMNQG